MKRVNITIFSGIIAIVLFVILTIIQNKMINNEPKITVLTANTNISYNTELKKEMFTEIEVPVFLGLNNNSIKDIGDIEEKFARENINKGQIVFLDDIGTKEELKILESPIGLEKIAIDIKAPKNAVAYQLKPKDRIHLYFSGRYGAIKESIYQFGLENIEKGDNSMYTTCLLRDIEVIGIYDENGTSVENEKFSKIDTVVVAVDSHMAKLINNLRNQGTFDITK